MGKQTARANLTIPGAIAMILAAAGASAQQAPPADKPVLGEIIVTAQKRAESVADVPDVCVASSPVAAREFPRHDSFPDLAALRAGPQVTANGTAGQQTHLAARHRTDRLRAPTVGDLRRRRRRFGSSGIFQRETLFQLDLDCLTTSSSIEVLRGPQGTLYGASSIGGLLKYVTNAPRPTDFEFRAGAGMSDVEGTAISQAYAVTGVSTCRSRERRASCQRLLSRASYALDRNDRSRATDRLTSRTASTKTSTKATRQPRASSLLCSQLTDDFSARPVRHVPGRSTATTAERTKLDPDRPCSRSTSGLVDLPVRRRADSRRTSTTVLRATRRLGPRSA